MVSLAQGWLEIASTWSHDTLLSTSQVAELAEYLENLNNEMNHRVSLKQFTKTFVLNILFIVCCKHTIILYDVNIQ